MTEETFDRVPNGIELAGDIVAAYVSNNPVPVAELPSLIRSVHSAISGLTSASASVAAAPRGRDQQAERVPDPEVGS